MEIGESRREGGSLLPRALFAGAPDATVAERCAECQGNDVLDRLARRACYDPRTLSHLTQVGASTAPVEPVIERTVRGRGRAEFHSRSSATDRGPLPVRRPR